MSRRILLIDADSTFRSTLGQQLAKYRFEITTEPDGDKAIAIATRHTPELIIVAVEEPEKAGFKVFQRCKKGVLAQVPVILLTSSVSTDSFAKHRGLKTHADEYIDKRTASNDELLGKIDSLIGLGDASEEDLDIPVEVDEIPLSHDDMVLEEEVADHDARPARFDSAVDAETDAAFAAILGGDGRPSTPALASPPSIAPPAERDDDEPSVVKGVPAPVYDGGRSDDLPEDEAVPEPVPHPLGDIDRPPLPLARTVTAPMPVPDLGLDAITATETASGQSGIHDRRALRKIDELERQISQMKNELERTRASADAAARGTTREREFLNLREQIIAKDKELHRVKDEAAAIGRELAEVQDSIKRAYDTNATLESKIADLEKRTSSVAALEAKEQTLSAQVVRLHEEIEQRAQAVATAEAARAELERELASERALRAASASDAERALRMEREQVIARHQAELTNARSEASAAQQTALAALREQLESDHGTAVAVAIDNARSDAIREVEERATRSADGLRAELQRVKDEHVGALGRVVSERDEAMARIVSERDEAVALVKDEHDQHLARLEARHAAQVAQARGDAEAKLAEATTEVERLRIELAAIQADAESALGGAAADQAAALGEQAIQHAQELADRERAHGEARRRDADAHEAALAQLKAELERQAAHHGTSLDSVRAELDEAIAQHELAKGELVEEQRRIAEELRQAHEVELAKVHEDRQRTLAEAHAAAERAIAEHKAELEQHTEAAAREAAEHRNGLLAAKRALEELAAQHKADREALEQAHKRALDDQIGQHERALAVANGEIVKTKAVADAEHNRAITAQAAEHARTLTELGSERDELQRGLSSARDTIKRSENELASAVQTIADRNAELRAHAQAIAERDQRIADLRKEIETLETENASYQEQVLRAYQKIKSDEAMVARAKKAMAIALTVLDDQGNPKSDAS